MKTHTVEGQQMLERVGGVLARVGVVVRASHERWDGGGYPDGLAGEEIPLASRIVSACDAYNAMTTDRSYRRALPVGRRGRRAGALRRHPVRPRRRRGAHRGRSRPRCAAPTWQLTLSAPEPEPEQPPGGTAGARARSARRVIAGAGSVASTNSAPSAIQPA